MKISIAFLTPCILTAAPGVAVQCFKITGQFFFFNTGTAHSDPCGGRTHNLGVTNTILQPTELTGHPYWSLFQLDASLCIRVQKTDDIERRPGAQVLLGLLHSLTNLVASSSFLWNISVSLLKTFTWNSIPHCSYLL